MDVDDNLDPLSFGFFFFCIFKEEHDHMVLGTRSGFIDHFSYFGFSFFVCMLVSFDDL